MSSPITKRIFIVDDDPFWTNVLFRLLTEMGYTNIVTFSNGYDCMSSLHLNPGFVFVDYNMDEMDGLELLLKIKNYFPDIGVVICTAHNDLQTAINAIKLGSYDYLLKHCVNKKKLQEVIEAMHRCQEQPEVLRKAG
jgi:DNA-binding NtrC family response regulator